MVIGTLNPSNQNDKSTKCVSFSFFPPKTIRIEWSEMRLWQWHCEYTRVEPSRPAILLTTNIAKHNILMGYYHFMVISDASILFLFVYSFIHFFFYYVHFILINNRFNTYTRRQQKKKIICQVYSQSLCLSPIIRSGEYEKKNHEKHSPHGCKVEKKRRKDTILVTLCAKQTIVIQNTLDPHTILLGVEIEFDSSCFRRW